MKHTLKRIAILFFKGKDIVQKDCYFIFKGKKKRITIFVTVDISNEIV